MEFVLQVITLFVIILTTATVYKTILSNHSKVSCNMIMMAAMALSTMNGLMIGTMLALTQSFSLNCILSMIVGIGSGLILGAMFNYMTTIEGVLGGTMGGLMGAMLGEMLVVEYIYTLAGVLTVIIVVVTMLLIKHIKEEGQAEQTHHELKRMNCNRFSLLVAFSSVILFSGILWGTSSPTENMVNSENVHQHDH